MNWGLLWVILILFLLPDRTAAQYGYEWIDFSQVYYKIPVARDGIYRITYNDLLNAGFPVNNADPRRIQLFHRGVEQGIHVEGESDARFDAADFIEFYGRKNDGNSDTPLYRPAEAQPHRYYNLFNDTTAYFLTVNNQVVAGKRMPRTWEVNVSGLPAEAFHLDEKLLVQTQEGSQGAAYFQYVRNTFFDVGEGWTGQVTSQNQSIDYTLNALVLGAPAGGTPQLDMLVAGRADIASPHRVEIYAGPSSGSVRLITTRDIERFNVERIEEPLNWTDIGADGRLVVRMRVLATGTSARASVSYIRVIYPQQLNAAAASEKYFLLRVNPGGKSFVPIQNPPANARLYDITDDAHVIWYVPPGSSFNPVISGTTIPRKLLLTNTFLPVPSIKRVNFRPLIPSQHNYIIISHRQLMKPAGNYSDAVKAYAGYRVSSAGGSYDTLVMEIHQLYNQFNYGEISPLAIHRFMKFMVDGGNPRYLFIIGKGLEWYFDYHRNPTDSRFIVFKDLVPSAGSPASDIYYTVGLGDSQYEPAVPTGRLSVTNPQQVAAYLDKMKETETMPFDALWRKRVVHLSGGITDQEVMDFRRYLRDFAAVAENIYLGGEVRSKSKNSVEVGEIINITEEVNQGVSLVTFFGHSSPVNADFEVGFVSNPAMGYNNPGKYPVFLINGCQVGDFFSTGYRFGEDWINAVDKGAIGFVAHSYFGFTTTLRYYSDLFYRVAFADHNFRNRGLGEVQQEVSRRYMQFLEPNALNLTQINQMVLLGDPAVRLFGATKPDYSITRDRVFFTSSDGKPITGFSESLTANLIVHNTGIALPDSLHVRVTRIFNDGTTQVYDSLFTPVFYSDTLKFALKQEPDRGFGNNTFIIELDPHQQVSELQETNNAVTIDLFIPRNLTRNLLPYDFAVINQRNIELKFSSTDILGEERGFLLEMDTLSTFTSPFKQSFTLNGTLIEHPVDLLEKDSVVYYWRTRFSDPQPNEVDDWSISSFSYIQNGKEGWAQMRFPQYLSNSTAGLVNDPVLEITSFEKKSVSVSVTTFGSNYNLPGKMLSVKINNEEYTPTDVEVQCRNNTLNIMAFSKQSLLPYAALTGVPACGRRPFVINSFTDTELQANIAAYSENVIAGDSVVLFTIGNPNLAALPPSSKTTFESLGISADQLNSILPGEPVVIFARKGSPAGTAKLVRTTVEPASEQELSASGTITGSALEGSMTSTIIGPSRDWYQLIVAVDEEDQEDSDFFAVEVTGITQAGERQLLLRSDDGVIDLSAVTVEDYPYLQFRYIPGDSINLTPLQLRHWIVTYTPEPEGVLLVQGNREAQEVMEGQPWKANYAFYNISDKLFRDSLQVRFELINQQSRRVKTQWMKIPAPLPGLSSAFEVTHTTQQQVGLNDVTVAVNPRILPEQYYDNNQLVRTGFLRVTPDQMPPVLSVTVDGRYLINGDYVSPNPHIRIMLRDENLFLPMIDPELVRIRLQYPGDVFSTVITYDRSDVQWMVLEEGRVLSIDFKPVNLRPGIYRLDVEGRDASNNRHSEPYRISFEVTEASAIVILPPHPNPSSGTCWFDVVAAGTTPPDLILITFYALDGRIVNQVEVKQLRIGTNRIAWDGMDFIGNPLPSGLYLYRMQVFSAGEEVTVQLPEGEKFLQRGYGKIILNR
jgi:hypothetical protein